MTQTYPTYKDDQQCKLGDRVLADVNGTVEPSVVQALLSTGHITVAFMDVNAASGAIEVRKADIHPSAALRLEAIDLKIEKPRETVVKTPPPPPREPKVDELVLFNPGAAWVEAKVTKVWGQTLVNLQVGSEPEQTSISKGEGVRNWRFKD